MITMTILNCCEGICSFISKVVFMRQQAKREKKYAHCKFVKWQLFLYLPINKTHLQVSRIARAVTCVLDTPTVNVLCHSYILFNYIVY